jgi:hypothetical protein
MLHPRSPSVHPRACGERQKGEEVLYRDYGSSRACGERLVWVINNDSADGSSPRVRGTQLGGANRARGSDLQAGDVGGVIQCRY